MCFVRAAVDLERKLLELHSNAEGDDGQDEEYEEYDDDDDAGTNTAATTAGGRNYLGRRDRRDRGRDAKGGE